VTTIKASNNPVGDKLWFIVFLAAAVAFVSASLETRLEQMRGLLFASKAQFVAVPTVVEFSCKIKNVSKWVILRVRSNSLLV
jgi:hypothetical protein